MIPFLFPIHSLSTLSISKKSDNILESYQTPPPRFPHLHARQLLTTNKAPSTLICHQRNRRNPSPSLLLFFPCCHQQRFLSLLATIFLRTALARNRCAGRNGRGFTCQENDEPEPSRRVGGQGKPAIRKNDEAAEWGQYGKSLR